MEIHDLKGKSPPWSEYVADVFSVTQGRYRFQEIDTSKTLGNAFHVNSMHGLSHRHGNHIAWERRECLDPRGNWTPRMNCQEVPKQCPNEWRRRGRECYVLPTASVFEAKLKTKMRKTKTRMRFCWTPKKHSNKKKRKRKKRQQKCGSRLYFFSSYRILSYFNNLLQ